MEDREQLWPSTDAAWSDSAWRKEITTRVRAHRRKRGTDEGTMSFEFEERTGRDAAEADLLAEELPPPPSRYQRIAVRRAQAQSDADNLIVFPPPPPAAETVEQVLVEPIPETPRIVEAEAGSQEFPAREELFLELDQPFLESGEAAEPYGVELPLQVAPLADRIACALIDAGLALTAYALFAGIVLSSTAIVATQKTVLVEGLALAGMFWAVYQQIFLIYSGTTPGMRVTSLGLCTFDDTTPNRTKRVKRGISLTLSLMSFGLGFLWSLMDEDGLGWHDRISRTYLRSL